MNLSDLSSEHSR